MNTRSTTNLRYQPPSYFFAILILMVVLHFAFPVDQILDFPFTLLGMFPLVIGLYTTLKADNMFSRVSTAIKSDGTPTHFVKNGPFALSRNPMYLGFVLSLLGVALLLGSLISILGPVVMFLILDRKFIVLEESTMLGIFGEEFIKYRSEVRRWL